MHSKDILKMCLRRDRGIFGIVVSCSRTTFFLFTSSQIQTNKLTHFLGVIQILIETKTVWEINVRYVSINKPYVILLP